RGASCLSDCVNGRTSSDQWDSVLFRDLRRSSGDSNVVAAETAAVQARCNPPATFHRGLPRFQRTLIIPAPLLNPSGHSETFTRLAYRPSSQTARWKRGIIPPLHE